MNKNRLIYAFVFLNVVAFWTFLGFFFFRGGPTAASGAATDDSGLLFAAATLVLTVLTVFLAIIAVVGWAEIRSQAVAEVKKALPEAVKEAVKTVENRLEKTTNARFSAVVGSIFTQLFPIIIEETDPREILDVAIKTNKEARRLLDELPDEDERDARQRLLERKASVLNNLAYCYALRKGSQDGEEAISLAAKLSQNNKIQQDPGRLDTWARVMIEFHDLLPARQRTLAEVKRVLEEMIREGDRRERGYAEKNMARLMTIEPSLFPPA